MTAEASALDDGIPHILVVDDDTRLRKLLQKFLRENGFRVTLAQNAADAKTRLGGLQFDVIILDVMMPGQSGLELTEELRGRSEVPILLLSALSETESRITGLELGADDYLGKPFERNSAGVMVGCAAWRRNRARSRASNSRGSKGFPK